MTYKDSNWTRGELGNVPDRDYGVCCDMCGESYSWQDYWRNHINGNPQDKPFWCESCWGVLIEQARIDRRKEQNNQLTAY